MTISRYSSWLQVGDDDLFFWHHFPDKICSQTAVIIIGPIGPEYMHCFRSVKLLADELAHSGYHSIRYDPIGMGNSSGNLEDCNIWDKWIGSPHKLTEYLSKEYSIKEVILIGLRSGCIVLSDTIKKLFVRNAVFWYPYAQGAKFIRDIQLLDKLLYKNIEISNDKILDGGGYPITAELQSEINKINLVSQDYNKLENALVINSKETTSKSRLYNKFIAEDINAESLYLEGLDAMTKQAAISKIPYSNIKSIIEWLNKTVIKKREESKTTQNKSLGYTHNNFKEVVFNIPSQRNIFSILTTPIKENIKKIVIIVNTGAAHHVGPNRFHADAARLLAEHGVSTLRMDLSNLGDSTYIYDDDAHHPYPQNATEDIDIVIECIAGELKYKDIILCGLCSGAHNIFHAAIKSKNKHLQKIIIINPLTFYWKPGQSIFAPEEYQAEIEEVYYQKQMYDYKKWLKLVTNPKKIINIVRFILLYIVKKCKSVFASMQGIFKVKADNILEHDIEKLGEKNISISLIYSKDDPGQKILMSKASGIIKIHSKRNLYSSIEIPDADHTFSSRQSRQKLLEALINCVIH